MNNLQPSINLPDTEQFDPQQIALLRGLRKGALLPQLLRVYREQVIKQVLELHAAVTATDHDAARVIAHTLKSASFTVGACVMGELCTQLESAAKQSDQQQVRHLQALIESCLTNLLPALDGYLTP